MFPSCISRYAKRALPAQSLYGVEVLPLQQCKWGPEELLSIADCSVSLGLSGYVVRSRWERAMGKGERWCLQVDSIRHADLDALNNMFRKFCPARTSTPSWPCRFADTAIHRRGCSIIHLVQHHDRRSV